MTMPMNLHPQYITDENGQKISVVLPVEEFEQILEDIEDLKTVAQRKDEPTTSHEDFLQELKADGIIHD